MFELAGLGAAQADPATGKLLRVNPTLCRITGYSEGELLGLTFFEITHPEDREEDLEGFRRVVRGNEPEYSTEKRYIHKDGRVVWVSVRTTIARDEDGRPARTLAVVQDITARKRAEEQTLFQARLLEQVRTAVIAIDLQGTVTHWNEHAERLYGWLREEALGRDIMELTVGPVEVEVAQEIMERLRAGETWEGEFIVRRKDGSTFPAHVSASLIYDARGRAAGIVGISTDMSGQKWAEEERDRIFTLSLDLLCIAGLDGYFKRTNPAFEGTLGYSSQELLEKPFVEFVHPDDRAATIEEIEKLATGAPTISFENRYRCKDGSYVWLSWKAAPVVEEGLIYAAAHDITERKRAEEEIRRSEERFRLLVEGVRDYAIFMLDPDGKVTSWNEGGYRLKGYRREEILGRHFSVFYSEEDVEHGRPERELKIARDEGAHEAEGWQVRNDGSRFWASVLITALEDEEGRLRGFSKVTRDITEKREAEEALREIRDAERVRIARDLHDGVLQDLTYALQTTQGFRTTSSSRDIDQSTELEEAVRALRQSIRGLRGAVYDLRSEATGEESFVRSVRSLVELNRQMNPGCEVELEVGERFPEDKLPEQLKKELLSIVQEAMSNVRRHSGARRVSVALTVLKGKLRAEISDNGRGFDSAGTPVGLGTRGMQERARELGGDLEIRSKPGEGTKVRFELALERERGVQEETRILLVEDHASFRQAAASVFEREPGFTVVGKAGSMAEARTMLDGVDVAIIDLGLPDGFGGDLIRELRARSSHAQALVLSAALDRAEVARAVESGAAGVMHKSAYMEEVVDAVGRLRAGETLMPLEEVVELLRFAGSRKEQEHEARWAITQLTPREKEVLWALAEGLDGEEIAKQLGISAKTERNHIASIFTKLGVHSRLQALVFALRYGIVDVS